MVQNHEYDMPVWIQVSGGSIDTRHSMGPSPSLVALERYCKGATSIWDNGLEEIQPHVCKGSEQIILHRFEPHQNVLLQRTRHAGEELQG